MTINPKNCRTIKSKVLKPSMIRFIFFTNGKINSFLSKNY